MISINRSFLAASPMMKREDSKIAKKIPHHKAIANSKKRRKRRVRQLLLLDSVSRLALHEEKGSRRSSEKYEETDLRDESLLLDFPEIKWVDEDYVDNCHFYQGEGSPCDCFADDAAYLQDLGALRDEGNLKSFPLYKSKEQKFTHRLLRSKAIHQNLVGITNDNIEAEESTAHPWTTATFDMKSCFFPCTGTWPNEIIQF
jgi:hypothetical protein